MKHLNEVAREPLLGRYEPGEKKTYILPNCLRKMLIDNGFSYERVSVVSRTVDMSKTDRKTSVLERAA